MDNTYEGTHDLGDIIDGEQKYVDIDYAKWYSGNANSPSDEEICCNFNKVVTEFGCQGLEMDMAILGWDTDMTWYNNQWHPWGRTDTEKEYRKNSYRVLLTRGRDGIILYLPNHWKFNKTYEMLRDDIGIPVL